MAEQLSRSTIRTTEDATGAEIEEVEEGGPIPIGKLEVN